MVYKESCRRSRACFSLERQDRIVGCLIGGVIVGGSIGGSVGAMIGGIVGFLTGRIETTSVKKQETS